MIVRNETGVLFLENNDMSGPLPADFGQLDWSK
jgi:hypothetical protein